MVGGDSLWILERAMTTSKMESQNVLIITNTATWQRNVEKRKKKKQGDASNVTRNNISPRIAKKGNQ